MAGQICVGGKTLCSRGTQAPEEAEVSRRVLGGGGGSRGQESGENASLWLTESSLVEETSFVEFPTMAILLKCPL